MTAMISSVRGGSAGTGDLCCGVGGRRGSLGRRPVTGGDRASPAAVKRTGRIAIALAMAVGSKSTITPTTAGRLHEGRSDGDSDNRIYNHNKERPV
jgi:hypothetical protein